MAKTKKTATPSHQAVGRVVRALTYPIISAEYDFTLRELNALATLAHINQDARVTTKPTSDSNFRPVDTFDAMYMQPGAGQSFWEEEQFLATAKSLEAKGLVTTEATIGKRIAKLTTTDEPSPGLIVKLTKAGEELVDSLAGNLAKSLSLLDREDVRKDLALYESC
jgi:hypothetical protein